MKVKLDLLIGSWKVSEARAFRAAVGQNPEQALNVLRLVLEQAQGDARAAFGAAVDEPGWEPPDDWLPPSLLSLDPSLLLGFAWIAQRRAHPALTLDEFADQLEYQNLLDAFWGALTDAAEDAAAPLAKPKKTGRARSPASPSASSTAGRSPMSTTSPSKSSVKQSATSMST